MSTWGCKTFENDATLDWLFDLEEAKDEAFLLQPINEALRVREPDIDVSLEALAAAEIIAAARLDTLNIVPGEGRKWIRKIGFSPGNATVRSAIKAVVKVEKASELKDSWKEAGKVAAWQKAVASLRQRLERSLEVSAAVRHPKPEPRQTLAEFIKEVAAKPDPQKRQELCARLMKLSNPNRPVGGKGLNSMTPLHWVAMHGFVEEAKILIDRGAVVDPAVGCMARPIAFALDKRQYKMVDLLIACGANKEYALLSAIQNGQIDVAEKLRAAGADLRDQNEAKMTLLHFAARAGSTKSIHWLLDKGANINALDCTGETPLFHAVMKPSLACVKALVERGAELQAKNEDGETALDLAKLDFIPQTISRYLRRQIEERNRNQ